jgi:hypothetical protein
VLSYVCYVNSLDRVKSTFKNLCLANPRIKVAGYFSTALCEHDSIQLSCPRTNVAIWGDKKRRVRAANAPKDSFSVGDHHRSRMLSRTCVCACVFVCVCMCVCVSKISVDKYIDTYSAEPVQKQEKADGAN